MGRAGIRISTSLVHGHGGGRGHLGGPQRCARTEPTGGPQIPPSAGSSGTTQAGFLVLKSEKHLTRMVGSACYQTTCQNCPGQDLNLHALRRYHLKVVRLPISPPGRRSSRILPRGRAMSSAVRDVPAAGLEPATSSLGNRCSIQMSYAGDDDEGTTAADRDQASVAVAAAFGCNAPPDVA
jgi:hypothetical protein